MAARDVTTGAGVMRAWIDRRIAARILGILYLAGALTGGLALALPNSVNQPLLLLAIVTGSGATGGAVLIAGSRLPGWVHFLLVIAGGAVILGAAVAGGVAYATYSLMLVWMVLYGAYFFTERFIVVQLALFLGGFAVVLAAIDAGGVPRLTLWLLTGIVLALTAYVISTVVRHRTRAQRELRNYFDLAIDMLCTMRPDGTVVEANRAWQETLGYRPEAIHDRDLRELIHPEDLETTERAHNGLLAGRDVIDLENRYRTDSGEWRWLNWRATFDSEAKLIYARATDITERKARLEKVASEARRDFLTGLPNRRWLSEEIDREISRAARGGSNLSLAVCDLDHFKEFNDTHGHLAGDQLLREAADAWDAALRSGDFLARIGGEEFVVLMPGCDLAMAIEVVERLRAATPVRITCSAGVAEWSPSEDAEDLIQRADVALYESKSGGRDRVSLAQA